MKAIEFTAPRQIRLVDDMPKPAPDEGEVLVRCTHAGLCGGNVGPYTGSGHWADINWPAPLGWQGHESLGVIVESRNPDWEVGTPVLAQDKQFNGFCEYFVPKNPSLNRLPTDIEDVVAVRVFVGEDAVPRCLDTVRVIGPRRADIGGCRVDHVPEHELPVAERASVLNLFA